ncbi:MAG: hypothetical protein AB4426_01330 [Xenococcaceae cyanobacterium]
MFIATPRRRSLPQDGDRYPKTAIATLRRRSLPYDCDRYPTTAMS